MPMPKPEFWQIPAATAATERADKLEAALAERLQHIAERFPRAVLASSLAVEDMIITDQICRHALLLRHFFIIFSVYFNNLVFFQR